MATTLFTIKLGLPKEYEKLIDRILEVATLFTTIHILIHLSPPASSGLFATNFWQMLLFMAIGFSAYYLVIKRLFRFQCVGDNNDPQSLFTRIRTWIKNQL